MISRRIIWALSAVLCGLLFLFVNSGISLALLILCFALPLISFLIALSGKKRVLEDVEIKNECIKGETVQGIIITDNKSKLFYHLISATLKSENIKTREITKLNTLFFARPNKKSETKFEFSSDACGLCNLNFESIFILDFLRLFKIKIVSDSADSVIVFPQEQSFDTESEELLPLSESQNNEKKSSKGGEILGIREYVVGDEVRNIHWKLSQKTDRLLVKEFGEAEFKGVLVLADNAYYSDVSAQDYNSVCENFVCLCNSLFESGNDFFAGFNGVCSQVTRRKELEVIIRAYLSAPNKENLNPLGGININDFSKIILLTASDFESEDGRIKVINCKKEI